MVFLVIQVKLGECLERETLPIPTGRVFNHAPSLLKLEDGTLLAAWSSGSKEKHRDTAIVLSFKTPSSRQWSRPQILIDTPNKADGNPVVFSLGDEIYCFYSSLWGTGWSTAQLFYTKSALNRHAEQEEELNFSWEQPKRVFPFYRMGDLARAKPIVLDDKTFLLSLYKEFSGYYSYVCKFEQGKVVRQSPLIRSKPGNLQPAIVSSSDGKFFMLMRPEDKGYFWQSISKDKGETWNKPEQRKDLLNPASGFDLLKLASGNVILVFNGDSKTRTNLTIALSKDEGKSFPVRRVLEEEKNVDFAYPSVMQDSTGKIHIVYSVDKEEIRHIALDEYEIYDTGR